MGANVGCLRIWERGKMSRILVVAVLLLASVANGHAQTVDVRGEWNLAMWAKGKIELKLVIATEGDRLVARLVAPTGESIPATVTLTGKDVRIEFDVKDADPAKPFHVTLIGTVANEKMSGAADFGPDGSIQWTATRTKAP